MEKNERIKIDLSLLTRVLMLLAMIPIMVLVAVVQVRGDVGETAATVVEKSPRWKNAHHVIRLQPLTDLSQEGPRFYTGNEATLVLRSEHNFARVLLPEEPHIAPGYAIVIRIPDLGEGAHVLLQLPSEHSNSFGYNGEDDDGFPMQAGCRARLVKRDDGNPGPEGWDVVVLSCIE